MKNTKKQETAMERYTQLQKEIGTITEWINCELESHAEKAKANPKNWGFAGDLGAVKDYLMDILTHLSGFDKADLENELAEMNA